MSELRMMGRKGETGRCIFCGKVGTWWECGCEWGEGIRAGKLLKPRTVVRGGVPVIELCEELRAAARAAGVITREYGRAAKGEVSGIAGKTPVTDKKESRESVAVRVSAVTDKLVVPDNVPVTDKAKCVVCGKGFRARRTDAKYCSGACRVRALRRG
jgi:hypothetical protein